MTTGSAVARTDLPLPLLARGKVRDIYAVGEDRLLLVATDRISAFDVVMPQPIPWKGAVLTQLTAWWLSQLGDLTPHHLLSADAAAIAAELPLLESTYDVWAGRALLVRRTRVVPIECVVRGYLTGSAWNEYRRSGTLAGETLPVGLVESVRLEPPIFSPATKAETGHDENITFDEVRLRVGNALADALRRRSLAIFERGRQRTDRAGIVIADTKFEFGTLPNGDLLLIDEVMTPDSSRFWPAETYRAGQAQPSLDKQPVRDYLEGLVVEGRWNREPPGPDLPDEVVRSTSERYRMLFERLTGFPIEEFAAHAPGSTSPP